MEETPTHAKLYGIALYLIGHEIQRLKATEQYHKQQNYDISGFSYFSPSLLRTLVRLPNFHFDSVTDELIKTTERIAIELESIQANERKFKRNDSVTEHRFVRCLTKYYRALRPLIRGRDDVALEFTEIRENFERWKRDEEQLKEYLTFMANMPRVKRTMEKELEKE